MEEKQCCRYPAQKPDNQIEKVKYVCVRVQSYFCENNLDFVTKYLPLVISFKNMFRNTSHWEKVLCLCDIIVKRSYSERQFYGQPIIGNDLLVRIESLYKKKEVMRLAYIFSIVKTNIDECMCYATFTVFPNYICLYSYCLSMVSIQRIYEYLYIRYNSV